jgi:hypothetical protein
MPKVKDSDKTFITLDYYRYKFDDVQIVNSTNKTIAYIRVKDGVAYVLTPRAIVELGGIDTVKFNNCSRTINMGSLIDIRDTHTVQTIIASIVPNPKSIIIKLVENTKDKKLLLEMGILTVKSSEKGFYYEVLDLIERLIKPPYKMWFCHQVSPRGNIEDTEDTTGRTLKEVALNGYTGNRLDIMVQRYTIVCDNFYNIYALGVSEHGYISMYDDNILEMFSNMLHKDILSIYTVKGK